MFVVRRPRVRAVASDRAVPGAHRANGSVQAQRSPPAPSAVARVRTSRAPVSSADVPRYEYAVFVPERCERDRPIPLFPHQRRRLRSPSPTEPYVTFASVTGSSNRLRIAPDRTRVHVHHPRDRRIGGIQHAVRDALGRRRRNAGARNLEALRVPAIDAHQMRSREVRVAAGLARGDEEAVRVPRRLERSGCRRRSRRNASDRGRSDRVAAESCATLPSARIVRRRARLRRRAHRACSETGSRLLQWSWIVAVFGRG